MMKIRRTDRGATLVEYALAAALVITGIIVVVGRVEDSGRDRVNADAPRVGTPNEANALPPPGTNPDVPDGPAIPIGTEPVTVHVSAYSPTRANDASDWSVTVVLEVSDEVGQLRSGVSCTTSFTPSTGNSTTTDLSDADGRCTLTQGGMKRNGSGSVASVSFNVVNLSGAMVTYAPAQNTVTFPQTISKP